MRGIYYRWSKGGLFFLHKDVHLVTFWICVRCLLCHCLLGSCVFLHSVNISSVVPYILTFDLLMLKLMVNELFYCLRSNGTTIRSIIVVRILLPKFGIHLLILVLLVQEYQCILKLIYIIHRLHLEVRCSRSFLDRCHTNILFELLNAGDQLQVSFTSFIVLIVVVLLMVFINISRFVLRVASVEGRVVSSTRLFIDFWTLSPAVLVKNLAFYRCIVIMSVALSVIECLSNDLVGHCTVAVLVVWVFTWLWLIPLQVVMWLVRGVLLLDNSRSFGCWSNPDLFGWRLIKVVSFHDRFSHFKSH